jgi:hypothetical protein
MKTREQQIKKLLDVIISGIVKARGKCEYRNKFTGCLYAGYTELDPAHIFNRSNLGVRWDPEDLLALCREHHTWADLHRDMFREIVKIFIIGEKQFNKIRRNSLKVVKPNYYKILEEIIQDINIRKLTLSQKVLDDLEKVTKLIYKSSIKKKV